MRTKGKKGCYRRFTCSIIVSQNTIHNIGMRRDISKSILGLRSVISEAFLIMKFEHLIRITKQKTRMSKRSTPFSLKRVFHG